MLNVLNKTRPNILLTEVCNRNCRYCFAKDEMDKAKKKEMDISDFEKVLDFLEKDGQKEVRLMGGEPTLHSQFRQIVDLAIVRGFKINLFTNGFFSGDLAEWLAETGGLVEYSFNLSAIVSEKSFPRREAAERNLEKLQKASRVYGSVNIDSIKYEEYVPVIRLIEKNNLDHVRIGLAANMVTNTSDGVKKDYAGVVETMLRVIGELKMKNGYLKITLSCGLSPCMFEKKQLDELSRQKVEIRGWGCAGKMSDFDITADLEILPCFYAEDAKEKKLTDFKNLFSIRRFSSGLFRYLTKGPSFHTLENCRACPHFKRRKCSGACLGYIMNNPQDKKELARFKKSFFFRVFKKMIFWTGSK